MVAKLDIPTAPVFARRKSDAPISPSTSESDVFGGYGHVGSATSLTPARRTRNARRSLCIDKTASTAFDREEMDEADADGEQVHTPGMEISFDLDSDVSPRISTEESVSPTIQASGIHTPHTYLPAPLEPKYSPAPPVSRLASHHANRDRAAAHSSHHLSFGHERQARNARAHASRSKGVQGSDRSSHESSSEGSGLSPDFLLGSNGRFECLGRVPMPISISSESELSDNIPDTASTLRTARPKRYISAQTGRYTAKTNPPATASPSYRFDWRHRSTPPPVTRSYSCPSFKVSAQGFRGLPLPHRTATTSPSAMTNAGDTIVAGPSSTLRRALSAGSRSKRNTFGPCEIYDDAGGEYAGYSDSSKLKPCDVPRRHPRSDMYLGDDSRRTSRYCPSGPSSARTSPAQRPVDDLGGFPGSVRMTPTPSLDGVVGVIRASSSVAAESKDGIEALKDVDAPGYAIESPSGNPQNATETATDKDGRVSNPKGTVDEGEKDVSDVYVHGNESPILPHNPLPPISTFAPSSTDAIDAAAAPILPDVVDATSLDDSPLHSTSVNNTRPSSSSSIPANKTPSPDLRVSVDSLLLSTPAIDLGKGDGKASTEGQHTPEFTSSRHLPHTPNTASRASVLYPTPPPRSPLPPTPNSAPIDRVARSSQRLSYQTSVRRSLTLSSPRSDRSSPTLDTDQLLPPFPSRRPVSSYLAEGAKVEETVNMALQVDYRNQPNMSRPGHLKQPSVPYSTRSSFSTSTVPLDVPHNYFNRNSAQTASSSRRSRYTASSSGSSIYSSDSDQIGKAYPRGERPDISTVFEEEGSFDAPQTLHRKQSNSTLDSAHYTRRQRAGTISSQYSDRAHPFASSASRSIERNMSGYLQPKMPSLQPSRSSPNLRAMAKEGAMKIHQVTLAESSDEDDDKCPVCIESLNASFKLPGEKPHIVPECGHALHEECFTHVYGDVPSSGSTRNVGLCGVCRQPIKIVEGGGDKKKRGKFAAMTGQGSGLKGGSSTSVNSSSRESVSSNLQANDPVVSDGSPKRGAEPRIVIPNITIRPETSTMNKQKRQLAAMITVQLPSAGERERYPRPNRSEASLSPILPASPISTSSMDGMLNPASVGATLPLDAVQADLERRLQDFGKSSLDGCGPLRLYDLLDVRKGDTKRPFLMYLFSDALACISEETPSALSKMFKGGTLRSSKSTRSMNTAQKTTLKLRGRIHFKHVRKVIDSSTANELSLTILMIDENHQTFILAFKDRKQYTLWKNMLDKVLKDLRDRGVSETGGNSASKVAKLMGTGAPIALRKNAVSPSSVTSNMSGLGLSNFDMSTMSPSSVDNEFTTHVTPVQPLGPQHTPVDIVLVLAIPQTASAPESGPLKIRLMRQALGFVLATLGPRDRISLVSCEQGVNVRKTPFLCATRPHSRRRLEQFVENLGTGGVEDEFEVEFAADERADLVTAMNVSLDVLLQRTAKNPLAGLIVVSDTAEVVRAGQLELIFARLDSVNIPIHTVGYGKAHDPSPLWLLCNQSNGTYTFVREWYHLRDTLAGIIGGLMSIAMTRARISLSCTDNDFRIARVMGVQTPIPAQGAKTIDIELRDLRFGETREILVELDYEGEGAAEPSRPNTSLSVTSSMDRLSLADSSSVVRDMVVEGRMADDVPAVEVDCSYHDPASGRSVSRLTQPILLTIPIVSAPSVQPPNSRVLAFDPVVKRRRMEILGSDMIARALLLMTRQNANQAERLLLETRGVIVRLINTITNSLPQDRPAMSRKEMLAVQNAEMMQSVVDDLEMMAEAVLDQPQVFERDHRNMVTQQHLAHTAKLDDEIVDREDVLHRRGPRVSAAERRVDSEGVMEILLCCVKPHCAEASAYT